MADTTSKIREGVKRQVGKAADALSDQRAIQGWGRVAKSIDDVRQRAKRVGRKNARS